MSRYPLPKQHTGFTLVELVMVIVLLGIVSVASTQFIHTSVGIYVDSTRRDELQQIARFANERVSRELRNALPGSVRANGNCLEFVPIKAASTYLTRVSDSAITSFQAVDFAVPPLPYRVAIYTLDQFDVYNSDPNAIASIAPIIDPVEENERTIFLITAHQFENESPNQRFYLINERVSFCAAVDGELTRYSGYTVDGQAQVLPNAHGGTKSLVAEHIRLNDNGPVNVFTFNPGTLQRSGVVHMDFRFSHSSEPDEWLRMSQDVFLRNTP
ncbi:MAG: type II secretion system protein [Spongiibacteraceae bacterium]|nr:type II secretion system protein [Spongiibacteraceae bacterium]MBN4055471.1 type II secretion system protein [bacterium AH-315-K03]